MGRGCLQERAWARETRDFPRSVWVLVALVRGVLSVSRLWFSNEEIMIMMTVVITRIIMMIALNGEHVVDWVRVLFACRKRYRLYTWLSGMLWCGLLRHRQRKEAGPRQTSWPAPQRPSNPWHEHGLRCSRRLKATFARGLKPRALKILPKAHRISNIITINQNLSHRNLMFVIRWRIRKN